MPENLDALKSNPAVIHLFTARMRLKRDGKEMTGNCIFHSEKTPSLRVWQADGGNFLYKCFGCGSAGSVIDFVAKADKIPVSDAIRIVKETVEGNWNAQKTRVENTFHPFGQEDTKARKTYSVEEYGRMETALQNNPAALEYLARERGISPETARKLRLGYRQDVGRLAGDSNADIAGKGWIVFPTFDGQTVTSLKYRSLVKKGFTKQPGMATAMFNTQTLDFLEPVFVVEGEIDACTLEQHGFRAVSLPNAQYKPTPADKDLLLRAECVILAGDNDPAGNKAMESLWRDLSVSGRAFLLRWPGQCKDANQFFLEECKRDPVQFRTKVAALVTEAKSRPLPNIQSLPESMMQSNWSALADHPDRLHFPWQAVDEMVNLLPGSVLNITATQTGHGKTALLMNLLIDACKRGRSVLNYSAELSSEEYSNIVAAHVLRKDRGDITSEDLKACSRAISDYHFYIGRNPDARNSDDVLDLIDKAIPILGIDIFAIDHLHHICQGKDNDIKDQNEAAVKIKNIAEKHGAIGIVISQPRKSDSKNKGKEIHITDIKGGGGIADAADAVISIHREFVKTIDPDNPPAEPYESLTKIRLLKGRSQGKGKAYAELMFLGAMATFSSVAREHVPDTFSFGEQQ